MMNPSIQRKENYKLTVFTFLQYLITDNFPLFSVLSDNNQIYIQGKLSDEDWQNKYEFLICTSLESSPTTYILKPDITPSLRIHMYKNRSLCLYHPNDLPYGYNFYFIGDIIPWLIKWIHFYEIWLRNGNIWLGPEAPHP